jgi:hypothetical protein
MTTTRDRLRDEIEQMGVAVPLGHNTQRVKMAVVLSQDDARRLEALVAAVGQWATSEGPGRSKAVLVAYRAITQDDAGGRDG